MFCTIALTCLEGGGGFDTLWSSKGWGISPSSNIAGNLIMSGSGGGGVMGGFGIDRYIKYSFTSVALRYFFAGQEGFTAQISKSQKISRVDNFQLLWRVKRRGFICITKRVCNRTWQRELSIIFMSLLVVTDMSASITCLQHKQRSLSLLQLPYFVYHVRFSKGSLSLPSAIQIQNRT